MKDNPPPGEWKLFPILGNKTHTSGFRIENSIIKQLFSIFIHRNSYCNITGSRLVLKGLKSRNRGRHGEGETGLLKENIYVVFRVVAPGRKIPIGELVERRRAERKDNSADMLRLARKMYTSSTFEALELIVEPAHRVEPVTPGGGEKR